MLLSRALPFISLASGSFAASIRATESARTESPITCGPSDDLVPLHHIYQSFDHVYTTSESERANLTQNGWQDLGIIALIYANPHPDLLPLYRVWDPVVTDHLYTTSEVERNNYVFWGYEDQGIAGYVYATTFPPGCGSIGLQRLYRSSSAWDHVYTTSLAEVNKLTTYFGYTFQNTACDVIPYLG